MSSHISQKILKKNKEYTILSYTITQVQSVAKKEKQKNPNLGAPYLVIICEENPIMLQLLLVTFSLRWEDHISLWI